MYPYPVSDLVPNLAFTVMGELEKMINDQAPELKQDVPSFTTCNFSIGLDANCFPSTFQIKQREFGNNRLKPKISMPERGTAQVWRANLKVNGLDIDWWVLRRYGSGLKDQMEVVSEKHLPKEFGLEDGDEVTVWMRE